MKNRKGEREQRLTWRSPPSPPARPSPLAPASRPPPLARRTRGVWPAPATTRRPPPASADALDASTSATHSLSFPSHSPHSPRAPLPPLVLSPSPAERSRRRRQAPPRPPPLPRFSDRPRGSASTPSFFHPEPRHRGSPTSPPRVVFPEHGRRTPSTDSPSPSRLRASRAPLRDRCELRHRFPLSPRSSASSNHHGHRSR